MPNKDPILRARDVIARLESDNGKLRDDNARLKDELGRSLKAKGQHAIYQRMLKAYDGIDNLRDQRDGFSAELRDIAKAMTA